MAIYSALTRLDGVYQRLEESFYSVGDYPLPEEKFISNNPYVSPELFEEFLDIINEIEDYLNGAVLIKQILGLIEKDSPINNLVMFNEQDFAMDLINENPESHSEENLNSVTEESSQQAHEEKTNLINEAHEDIKRLMEDLLPLLVD